MVLITALFLVLDNAFLYRCSKENCLSYSTDSQPHPKNTAQFPLSPNSSPRIPCSNAVDVVVIVVKRWLFLVSPTDQKRQH